RMACELRERFRVQMRGEIGADHLRVALAHVVDLAAAVQLGHRVGERLYFLRREQAWEKKVAVAVEGGELCAVEFHRCAPADFVSVAADASWRLMFSLARCAWLLVRRAACSSSPRPIALAIASCSSQTAVRAAELCRMAPIARRMWRQCTCALGWINGLPDPA